MTARQPKPAPVNVPWNKPPEPDHAALEAAAEAIGMQPEFEGEQQKPAEEIQPTHSPSGHELPPPLDYNALAKARADLMGQPIKQKSPFAPKPKAEVVEEKPVYPMGDAPMWGDFAKFIMKHGEHIIQARHPQPRGECVDTLWRGVTVFAHETCELRHKVHGWISWEDSQYE